MNKLISTLLAIVFGLNLYAQSGFDNKGAFVPLGIYAGLYNHHIKGGYHVLQDTSDIPDHIKDSTTVVLQVSDTTEYLFTDGVWSAIGKPGGVGGGAYGLADVLQEGDDVPGGFQIQSSAGNALIYAFGQAILRGNFATIVQSLNGDINLYSSDEINMVGNVNVQDTIVLGDGFKIADSTVFAAGANRTLQQIVGSGDTITSTIGLNGWLNILGANGIFLANDTGSIYLKGGSESRYYTDENGEGLQFVTVDSAGYIVNGIGATYFQHPENGEPFIFRGTDSCNCVGDILMKLVPDSGVTLYYKGLPVMETTPTGVRFLGTVEGIEAALDIDLDSALITYDSHVMTGNVTLTDAHAGDAFYNTSNTDYTITVPVGLNYQAFSQRTDIVSMGTGRIIVAFADTASNFASGLDYDTISTLTSIEMTSDTSWFSYTGAVASDGYLNDSIASLRQSINELIAMINGNDTIPIVITSPANNETFDQGESHTITTTVADPYGSGYEEVKFIFSNGTSYTDLTPPFVAALNTDSLGAQTVTARVYFGQGDSATSLPISYTVVAAPTYHALVQAKIDYADANSITKPATSEIEDEDVLVKALAATTKLDSLTYLYFSRGDTSAWGRLNMMRPDTLMLSEIGAGHIDPVAGKGWQSPALGACGYNTGYNRANAMSNASYLSTGVYLWDFKSDNNTIIDKAGRQSLKTKITTREIEWASTFLAPHATSYSSTDSTGLVIINSSNYVETIHFDGNQLDTYGVAGNSTNTGVLNGDVILFGINNAGNIIQRITTPVGALFGGGSIAGAQSAFSTAFDNYFGNP